jgi:putative transposase
MKTYPSDLIYNQLKVIKVLLENRRKRKYDLREIMNEILYITKSGCQWRILSKEFAQWHAAYYYFRKWKFNGVLEKIHDFLVHKVRLKNEKYSTLSVGIIYSQPIKIINVCQDNI